MKDAGIDHALRTDIMRHSPRNVTDKYYGRGRIPDGWFPSRLSRDKLVRQRMTLKIL